MGDSKQRAKLQAQFAASKKQRRERQRVRTEANRLRRRQRHVERHPADGVGRVALEELR
jgi:hypothetical protein